MEHNLSSFTFRLKLIAGINAKVYLKNWGAGFGSSLMCLLNNINYFNKYGVTIIPLWINNTDTFKFSYGKNDCFREFFDDRLNNLEDTNLIIINSDECVIKGAALSNESSDLSELRELFKNRFSIKSKYYTLFDNLVKIKEFDFSIHLRSNFQKRFHHNDKIVNIEEVIKSLFIKYGKNCTPFIATDVKSYLHLFLKYFPNAVYNVDCFRTDDDTYDSVPQITNPGIKHGEDVILDLIGLNRGKIIYMSESNIYLVTKVICDDNKPIISLRTLY